MDYANIDEVYAANSRFSDDFFKTVGSLTASEVEELPEGEKWSIRQIAEHISIVDEGMSKICQKLLNEARESGLRANGLSVSDVFREYVENPGTKKLEAPDRVQPTHGQSLADSTAKILDSQKWFGEMQPLFDEFDGTQAKFPHPHFGPLSAQEWLVLAGEHMHRHSLQIQKIVEKMRQ